MKLHEIYEGLRFVSIMEVAEKIVGLKTKQKFGEQISEADWNWLMLTCENQSVLRKLQRAVGSYITPTLSYNDIQSEFLRSGGTCAEALNYLRDVKQSLDDNAKSRVLQATDEVMNSAEMAEIAKQQAYIDLQNSYTEQTNDSAERVSKLADLAVDI